jgi:hypothetical protein
MKIGSILYNAIKAYLENEYMHDYRVVLHGILKNLCRELGFNKEEARIEELVDFLKNYILEKRTKKYYTFDFKINGNDVEGRVVIERFGKIFDTIEEIRKLLYVYYAYSKNPSLTAQKIDFLYKVFKPIFDIPRSNKEIIDDTQKINEYYNKFFDWLIDQYKTKNFLLITVVGESGSGKTVTTFYVATELAKRLGTKMNYLSTFTDVEKLLDFCVFKNELLDSSVFVFDEAYIITQKLENAFYKFLNVLRWYTQTNKAIVFIILHSRHQASKNLKQNVDYYFVLDNDKFVKVFNNSLDLNEIIRNIRTYQGRLKFSDGYLKGFRIILNNEFVNNINNILIEKQIKGKKNIVEKVKIAFNRYKFSV